MKAAARAVTKCLSRLREVNDTKNEHAETSSAASEIHSANVFGMSSNAGVKRRRYGVRLDEWLGASRYAACAAQLVDFCIERAEESKQSVGLINAIQVAYGGRSDVT